MGKTSSKQRIILCGGSDCVDCGMRRVRRALDKAIDEHGLEAQVEVRLSKCQDRCDDGPNLTLMPGSYAYERLKPDAARQIIAQHVIGGEPVAELLHTPRKKHGKQKRH